MKKLFLAVAAASMAGWSGGCALPTPGYSGGFATIVYPRTQEHGEMANRILRNTDYELRMLNDDIYSITLADPPSRLTKWNVR